MQQKRQKNHQMKKSCMIKEKTKSSLKIKAQNLQELKDNEKNQ